MEEKNNRNEMYVNAVTVSNTFFDFVLDFKNELLYEENGERKKDIDEAVKIRISPQMAKALAILLSNNVTSYEKDYGAIPTLPGTRG